MIDNIVEEDDSVLEDSVYEKRHIAHLAEMQAAFEKAREEQEKKKREKVAARQNAAIANRNIRAAGSSPRHSPMSSPRMGKKLMAASSSKKRKRIISEIGLPKSATGVRASSPRKTPKSRSSAQRNKPIPKQIPRVTRRSASASASPQPVRASKRSKRSKAM